MFCEHSTLLQNYHKTINGKIYYLTDKEENYKKLENILKCMIMKVMVSKELTTFRHKITVLNAGIRKD